MGGLAKANMPVTYADDADRARSPMPGSRRSPGSSRKTRSSKRCTLRPLAAAGVAHAGGVPAADRRLLLVPPGVLRFHGKVPIRRSHHPDVKEVEADTRGRGPARRAWDMTSTATRPRIAVGRVPSDRWCCWRSPRSAPGWVIGEFVFGGYFGNSIHVIAAHPAIATLAREFHGVVSHDPARASLRRRSAGRLVAGAGAAWFLYVARPELPAVLRRQWGVIVTILMEKYGFDRFNDWFLPVARASLAMVYGRAGMSP